MAGRFAAPPYARRPGMRTRGLRGPASQSGMVLLETALAIPLLAAVAVALAWGVSLGATTMLLGDAARQVARDVARGVAVAEALSAARESAPGASIEVVGEGASVVVVADQRVAAPVPILNGISVTLSQRVVIPREWT